jgi:serine/threonine-protein kinase RsbT
MIAPTGTTASGEVSIAAESDIVVARRIVRDAVSQLGFRASDVARIVTAASEIARNVYRYAGHGVMYWSRLENGGSLAIELKFVDQGPGIGDVDSAMREGYSTGGGLGMGLPGAKRLCDEFELVSAIGQGTTVILRKWLRE